MSYDILLITTGGTIDKVHDSVSESLISPESTRIPELLLRDGRYKGELTTVEACHMDSLDMTESDREHIASIVADHRHHHVLITHGTSTAIETGNLLRERFPTRRIVLVGAMVPASIEHSDALFNLGSAVTALMMDSTAGVYLVAQGEIFPIDQVRKDTAKAEFVRD